MVYSKYEKDKLCSLTGVQQGEILLSERKLRHIQTAKNIWAISKSIKGLIAKHQHET